MRISDWSSDVCSSDLVHQVCSSGRHRITAGVSAVSSANGRSIEQAALGPQRVQPAIELHGAALAEMALEDLAIVAAGGDHRSGPEIGRASWRERVCQNG